MSYKVAADENVAGCTKVKPRQFLLKSDFVLVEGQGHKDTFRVKTEDCFNKKNQSFSNK